MPSNFILRPVFWISVHHSPHEMSSHSHRTACCSYTDEPNNRKVECPNLQLSAFSPNYTRQLDSQRRRRHSLRTVGGRFSDCRTWTWSLWWRRLCSLRSRASERSRWVRETGCCCLAFGFLSRSVLACLDICAHRNRNQSYQTSEVRSSNLSRI